MNEAQKTVKLLERINDNLERLIVLQIFVNHPQILQTNAPEERNTKFLEVMKQTDEFTRWVPINVQD